MDFFVIVKHVLKLYTLLPHQYNAGSVLEQFDSIILSKIISLFFYYSGNVEITEAVILINLSCRSKIHFVGGLPGTSEMPDVGS